MTDDDAGLQELAARNCAKAHRLIGRPLNRTLRQGQSRSGHPRTESHRRDRRSSTALSPPRVNHFQSPPRVEPLPEPSGDLANIPPGGKSGPRRVWTGLPRVGYAARPGGRAQASAGELADGDTRATSIIQEGRLLARVRHPSVVTIYGAERIEDRVGLWMEFVRGRTLEQVIDTQGVRFGPRPSTSVSSSVTRFRPCTVPVFCIATSRPTT